MELRTSAFLALRVFPSGRALFALTAVLAAARSRNVPALAALADRAVTAAQRVRALEHAWALQQRGDDTPELNPVLAADRALDAELGALDALLAATERRFARRDPAHSKRIAKARATLAPNGIAAIVRAVHEEELTAVSELLALAQSDVNVKAVVADLALADDLAAIAAAREVLAQAVAQAPPERLRYKAITAARAEVRELLASVLVQALASSEGDADARAALAGPIAQQDDDIREYARHRRAVPDVDPDTGAIDDTVPPSETD